MDMKKMYSSHNENTKINRFKQVFVMFALILTIIAVQFGISRYMLNKNDEINLYFYEYRIELSEIVISPETYTGGEVTVTITTEKLGLSIQYQLGDTGEWIDYAGPFSVSENLIVNARLVSEKDNFKGPITSKEIKNIAVAKIGDEYFKTLAAAIEACAENAGDNQTKIEMLANTTESVVIPEGKNIVLDLCGATITGASSTVEEGSEESTGTDKQLDATITVNGNLNLIDSAKNEDGSLQGNGKVISTTDAAIKVAQTGNFTLGTNESGTDVSVSTTNPVIVGETYGVVVEENGEFNFYDGEVCGKTNAISGNVTDTPEGYKVATNVNGEYEVATLKTTYTITYDLNYLENDLYGEKIIQTDTYKDLATTISKKTTDYETAKYGKSIEFTMDNDVTSTYIGVYFDNSIVEYGKTYTWSVHLKASSEMSLKLGAEQQGFRGPLTITTDWEKYTYTFTAADTGYTAFVMYILQQANAGDKLYMHSLELMEGQPTYATDTKIEDSTLGELSNPVRPGYIFQGWYTKPDDGEKITSSTVVSKDVTYYAQWVPIKYEIEYNSNTGTGTMENTVAIYDVSTTLPESAFIKTGYTLKEWNTKPDGTGNGYKAGDAVKNLTTTNSQVITLYAIWEDTIAPNKEAPTGTGATNLITVNCNQTDDGTGIDETTVEYAIFNKDTDADGMIDSWSDWQSSNVFSELATNTEYQVKTRASDNSGNGPTESEIGTISTSKIENGILVIHKDNAQGEIIIPETSSENKNNQINNNIYLDITQSISGTTTVIVKSPSSETNNYSDDTTIVTQTGMYEIILQTTDGTNTVSDIYYVFIDKTSPTINPTLNSTTNSITVNSNAEDVDSGVANVTYTIKKGDEVIETNQTGEFIGLEDNTEYTVEITVTDKAGNVATESVVVKTEILTAGTIVFTESTSGDEFIPSNTESEKVWVNENVNTTLTQGNAGTTIYEVTAPDGTKTQYTADTQISTVEGMYVVTVITTDGKNIETIEYYFNIDKTVPTVTINPNEKEYTLAIGETTLNIATTVTATDNENGSGLAITKYAWATSNTQEPTESEFIDFVSGTEISKSVAGGKYYLWVIVEDNAGNRVVTENTTAKASGGFNVGYTIEYNLNGGTGDFASIRKPHGQNVGLSTEKPTREGYIFKGWSELADTSEINYSIGGTYTKDESKILYAVWSEVVASTTIGEEVTEYESVQEAITAAGTNSGAIVTLIKTNIEESVTVAAGQDIVLELNGKTLTSTGNTITNNGSLEIIDSSELTNGTLGSTATRIDAGENAYYIIDNYGDLTLTSGELSSTNTGGIYNKSTGIVEVTGGAIHTYGQAIRNGGLSTSETEPSVKITGGDIKTTLNAIVNGSVGLVHITGGTISSENLGARPTILMGVDGIIKIDGGTIVAETNRAITMWNSTLEEINGKIQINGGTITGVLAVTSNVGGIIEITGGTITGTTHGIDSTLGDVIITGGKIVGNSEGIYKTQGTLTIGNNSDSVSTTIPEIIGKEKGIQVTSDTTFNFYDGIIKGSEGASIIGDVSAVPTNYNIFNGTEVIDGTTYETSFLVELTNAVASTTIGTEITFHSTVQEAIDTAGANTGAKVTLLQETITESVTIADTQNIILNLNGNTLTYKNAVTLTNNGTLTIEGDGALTGNGASGVYPITNKGTLIKNGSSTLASTTAASSSTVQYIINNTQTGTVVINDGTLSSNDRGIYNAGSTNNASLTINGGTLTTTDYAIYNGSALSTEENPSVKISNAQVTSNSGDAIFNDGEGMVVVENSSITASTYGIHSDNAGTLIIKDSTITSTTSWGICNSSNGTVNVYNSNITGYVHGLGNASAASGILNVYSGNITGETNDGMAVGKGTVTLGTDDGIIGITNPKIQGKRYGLNMNSTSGKVYFYDGIIISTSSTSIYGGTVTGKPANAVVQTTSNSTGGQDSILIGAYVEYDASGSLVKGYDTLNLATEYATSGNTIKAMASLTETTAATVASGKELTLDLNAQTITLNEIALTNNGTLKITDSTSTATGKITKTASTTNPAETSLYNYGKLTVENGTINCTSAAIYNQGAGTVTVTGGTVSSGFISIYDIGTSNDEENPSVKVIGGTVTNSNTAPSINSSGGLTYITGGIIKNTAGLAISGKNVKITGGELTGGSSAPAVGVSQSAEISGGTINSEYQALNLNGSAVVTVTGGTLNCTSTAFGSILANKGTTITLGTNEEVPVVGIDSPSIIGSKYGVQIVEGATFNFYDGIIKGSAGNSIYGEVADVPDGYAVLKTTTDGIETAILSVGNYKNTTTQKLYATLENATKESESGSTIQVINGVTETVTATVDEGKTLTLDMNGKTTSLDGVYIANNGTLTVTGESGTLTSTIQAIDNSTTGVFNKEGNSTITATGGYSTIYNAGKVTLSEGTIYSESYRGLYNKTTGQFIMNGGILNSAQVAIMNYSELNTDDAPGVIINNGNITSRTRNAITNYSSSGLIEIKGGSIHSSQTEVMPTVYNETGTLKISGGTITSDNDRAVCNYKEGGTVIITGGKMSGVIGVHSIAGATLAIGTKVDAVSTSNPEIHGTNYGVINTGTFNFYDGIISGAEGQSISGAVSDQPDGYRVVNGTQTIDSVEYETSYLDDTYYVTFDDNWESGQTTVVSVKYNNQIGTLPSTATYRAGYMFTGWYTSTSGGTLITADTVITSDITVYALWEEANYGEYNSSGVAIAGYDTLESALSGATSGNTIKALNTLTETTASTVDSTKTLTLDLNGQTVTIDSVKLTNNGTLTIKDSSSDTSGKLVGNGTASNPTGAPIYNYGKLTFGNATVTSNTTVVFNQSTGRIVIGGATLSGGFIPIHNIGTSTDESNPSVKMTSGTLSCTASTPVINTTSTGSVYITGGTITSSSLCVNGGDIKITGGTFTGTGTAAPTIATGNNLVISGGTIKSAYMAVSLTSEATGTITGGTLTCTSGTYGAIVVNSTATLTLGANDGNVGTTSPSITGSKYGVDNSTGGTFNFYDGVIKGTSGTSINGTVTKVPSGYNVIASVNSGIETSTLSAISSTASTLSLRNSSESNSLNLIIEEEQSSVREMTNVNVENENITTETTKVVQISETYYSTFSEAVACAGNGDTLKILEDISLIDEVIISEDKNINLELNGKTITSTDINTITNNGILTISGTGIIRNEVGNGNVIYNTGTLNIANGVITTATNGGKSVYNNAGTINMSAGKIVTEGIGGIGIYNINNGKVAIQDGIIEVTGASSKCIYNDSELEINGGNIVVSGDDSIGIYNSDKAIKCVMKDVEILVEAEVIENYDQIKNTDEFKAELEEMKSSYGIYNNSSVNVEIQTATITVERLKGVGIMNNLDGTITLGVEDSEVSSATPIIYAISDNTTAIVNSQDGQIYFYDGKLCTLNSIKDVFTKVLENYEVVEEIGESVINTMLKLNDIVE